MPDVLTMKRLILLCIAAQMAITAHAAPGVAEPQRDPAWLRLVARQKRQLASTAGIDIAFVGDSLTEFWSATGKAAFDLEFHARKTINLGIAGDRTEHILYRVADLDFTSAKPRLIVLLAGTNNLGKDPPDDPVEVAAAVGRIATLLKKHSPESKVLVLSLLPSGKAEEAGLRKRILKTNSGLGKIASGADLEFLHVHDTFLDASGRWKRGTTSDGTHLTARGYDLLARSLSPIVRRLLQLPKR